MMLLSLSDAAADYATPDAPLMLLIRFRQRRCHTGAIRYADFAVTRDAMPPMRYAAEERRRARCC